jgi:hypothetical protein
MRKSIPGRRFLLSNGLQSVRENLKRRSSFPEVWWEPPASAGGAGLQSSGDAFYLSKMGFTGCGKTLVFEGYGL